MDMALISPYDEKRTCSWRLVRMLVFKFPMKILDFKSSGDLEFVAFDSAIGATDDFAVSNT